MHLSQLFLLFADAIFTFITYSLYSCLFYTLCLFCRVKSMKGSPSTYTHGYYAKLHHWMHDTNAVFLLQPLLLLYLSLLLLSYVNVFSTFNTCYFARNGIDKVTYTWGVKSTSNDEVKQLLFLLFVAAFAAAFTDTAFVTLRSNKGNEKW